MTDELYFIKIVASNILLNLFSFNKYFKKEQTIRINIFKIYNLHNLHNFNWLTNSSLASEYLLDDPKRLILNNAAYQCIVKYIKRNIFKKYNRNKKLYELVEKYKIANNKITCNVVLNGEHYDIITYIFKHINYRYLKRIIPIFLTYKYGILLKNGMYRPAVVKYIYTVCKVYKYNEHCLHDWKNKRMIKIVCISIPNPSCASSCWWKELSFSKPTNTADY